MEQHTQIPKMIAVDPAPQQDKAPETSSPASNSNSNSVELEPAAGGLFSNENSLRDTRLDFLRKILQKIKKHAEQMGFDGTMQISVIEVEPQTENGGENSMERGQPQLQQQRFLPIRPHFFAPFSGIQPNQWADNRVPVGLLLPSGKSLVKIFPVR